MISNLYSTFTIWRIKKAIQNQNIKKLKSFFKNESDLEILFYNDNLNTTLIEEILLSDYENNNHKMIRFFSSFFSKYPNFKNKLFNFEIELEGKNYKFKEVIFLVSDCFLSLEYLLDHKLISVEEEISVEFEIGNKTQTIKTILPYYSFIYSNNRAIQYFLLRIPNLFKYRDSISNQFLFYALTSSEDGCIDLLI